MKKRKAANMQVTRVCNNECVFCSNPTFEKEYTLEEAKGTAKKLKGRGITEIFLSGGEPTMCSFLLDIIRYLKEIGIEPRMITNGVKISHEKLVINIKEAGIKSVNVSIHSHKKDIADKLSQKEGHFEKSLTGIKNLLKNGFDVKINSTINSLNCKHLLDFVKFFHKNFSEINHFVFNFLDPGYSDGTLKSRAGRNPWIVARFTDFELELRQMVSFLKKHDKTFRVERVPLCYMPGFEEFSTETRKIVKHEIYLTSFIEKDKKNELREVDPKYFRSKIDCCSLCGLNAICAGIQEEYLKLHGENEFYPVFKDPDNIISRIKDV